MSYLICDFQLLSTKLASVKLTEEKYKPNQIGIKPILVINTLNLSSQPLYIIDSFRWQVKRRAGLPMCLWQTQLDFSEELAQRPWVPPGQVDITNPTF